MAHVDDMLEATCAQEYAATPSDYDLYVLYLVRAIRGAKDCLAAQRIFDAIPERHKDTVRGMVHAAIGLTGGSNGSA